MNLDRRHFLRKAGLFAATPLVINELASCTPSSKSEEKKSDSTATAKLAAEPSIKEFGIQLWTVKEDLAKDTKGVLKSLADYGYSHVESFAPEKSTIFWGMKPADFKAYLDSINLKMYSAHCNPAYSMDKKLEGEFSKLVDDAASIGMKYLINPFLGELKTQDDWKKAIEGFNRQGEICNKAGIRFGYHNHHFEFKKFADGTSSEQMMLDGTDPKLVDFELDLYWVVKAGENPEEWLKKYSNRFKLVHIKDHFKDDKLKEVLAKEKPTDDFWPVGASCDLGTGKIDFAQVLSTAKANGVEYFIVEQERFDGSTPMKSAEADANYMKKLILA